jgi:general secretion pathway protein D
MVCDSIRSGKGRFALLLAVALLVLAACASPARRAEQFAAQEEWLKAVLEYRKAYALRPADIELKSRLQQAEMKAADFYYQRGLKQLEQGDLDGALLRFQEGLLAMSDHSKLQQAMAGVLARKDAQELYLEAVMLRDQGKVDEARDRLRAALDAYPSHREATAALAALERRREDELTQGLALSSTAPVTLNFRQTDLKQACEFLAKSFGINIIFDEGVKSAPITLFAQDVTFEQGLNLLLTTGKLFHKRIGPNTILLAPDTKEKRGQYEDHLVRTFDLNVVRAKEMADILKGLVTVKKIAINEELNTLVVRDTEEVLKLVERIIESNDRKPAEILLDVEILEINRTKAEQLGLDLGTYSASAALPSPGSVPITGSISDAIEATATLTLPSATVRLFKQDVDAQVLANPKVRVVNGKAAKIHIGDRVPLRAATIVDATGQTRTTFDYKDIGIRLTVEPTVHLDNSALVKLGLEVSSLGENLGTAEEPAYRIGTRNADTIMLLRDGETAILGGLIRDEERNTKVKIPGLGDIPLIGAAFTSFDRSAGRTDVLLTITPRVVRSWQLVARANRQFYSGTETVYRDSPLFDALQVTKRSKPSVPAAARGSSSDPTPAGATQETTPAAPTEPDPSEPAVEDTTATPTDEQQSSTAAQPAQPPREAASTPPPLLSFGEPVYQVAGGQEFEATVLGSNFAPGTQMQLQILFNSQLMECLGAERGAVEVTTFESSQDAARGVLTLKLTTSPQSAGTGENAVLARIKMRGAKPGVSYIVYKSPAIRLADGVDASAQVRASRVIVN